MCVGFRAAYECVCVNSLGFDMHVSGCYMLKHWNECVIVGVIRLGFGVFLNAWLLYA